MTKRIRVLIVDDSALVRQMLAEILSADPGIEVVGAAGDPYRARDMIKQLNPDVLTLDVEMPRMDGLTFLSNLMRLRPMPVVMVSSLTRRGADIAIEALQRGAVDFVAKPAIDLARTLDDYAQEIIEKVKTAAGARIREPYSLMPAVQTVEPRLSADAVVQPRARTEHFKTTELIVALGASTGGTDAIKRVLSGLPADAPGMVITQHIPAAFSGPFARRMNACSAMTVCEAADGQQILPGHVYIAPGDRHLLVARDGARYVCRLLDGPPVNRHRPSVDVLFRSAAQHAGPNAIGVILTGMGTDGAQGLRELRDAGAVTLAQDEKTSVVWGMPGEAVKLGAAELVLPLDDIAGRLMQLARTRERREACA